MIVSTNDLRNLKRAGKTVEQLRQHQMKLKESHALFSMGFHASVDFDGVVKACEAASFESLSKAGAYIRGMARRSIGFNTEPSEPGNPPHTSQKTSGLKNAIYFKVEGNVRVVVGPTQSRIGLIGHTHEFGGTEGPKRPPAKYNANWKLQIGGHGPIRIIGGSKVAEHTKLTTEKQVERAKKRAYLVLVMAGVHNAEKLARYYGSGSSKQRRYPARPFMGPALDRAKDRLSQLWNNSVKGG